MALTERLEWGMEQAVRAVELERQAKQRRPVPWYYGPAGWSMPSATEAEIRRDPFRRHPPEPQVAQWREPSEPV